MKRKLKMVLALALAFCVAAALPNISYAANPMSQRNTNARMQQRAGSSMQRAAGQGDTVQPRYVNTAGISANLLLDGSTAHSTCTVNAKRHCHISVCMELQYKDGSSWKTKASWLDSTDGVTLSLTRTFGLTKRGSYRVKAFFNVAGEELSYTSSTRTY